jgi:hypothetical protein
MSMTSLVEDWIVGMFAPVVWQTYYGTVRDVTKLWFCFHDVGVPFAIFDSSDLQSAIFDFRNRFVILTI